jgi:hypothetical protein
VYGIKDILAANAAGAVLAIIDDIVLDVCIAVQVDSVHCAARQLDATRSVVGQPAVRPLLVLA